MLETHTPPLAPRACQRCHSLKKRCDRVFPLCLRCHMSKSKCVYSELPKDQAEETIKSCTLEKLQMQLNDLQAKMNVLSSHSTQQISSIPMLQVDGTNTVLQQDLQQDLHSLQHTISTSSDPCYRWDIKVNAEGIAIDTSAFTIADLLKGMSHSAQVLGIDEPLFMEAINQAQIHPALRWRTQDEGIVKRFLNVYSETQDDMDNTYPSATENDSSNYVMICLHNFFNCFYPWAPCFHKPTFMAKLANPAEHTLSFRLLILAICAYNASHALGFHEGEYPWAGVSEYVRSGQAFYVVARRILADICLDDGIEVWTIVALHYLSIYCLDKSKSRSLHYHSLATRMAIQRGYNISQQQSEESVELEIGHRLWWTLMLFSDILDWTGYTDGDLNALQETQIALPMPLPDEEKTTAEALAFYVHFIQNVMKHNGIHQGFIAKERKYRVHHDKESKMDESDNNTASPINPVLDFPDMEWQEYLPDSTRNTMKYSLQIVQQFTELTFHKRRILEARLINDDKTLSEATEDCISTANLLVLTFEKCYGHQLTHFNNVMELWHASIMSVICAVLLDDIPGANDLTIQQNAAEQHEHLKRLLQIFKDISYSRASEIQIDRVRDHNPAWDKFNRVLIAQGFVR
ncbi:hypothetical protein K450DRAFT_220562 [Umbelopsis ramanniana AG]|uniref:Zn(2)-C6 fungal-type domain-containing protein n=1 Tax=Umbelopsis ramanniana AG TaxID=1314678 RepID=A0AAD5EHR9_UMBRA|nr:uncharacterized protein K450DRAFT_220562 [Umbelopsis ramanniana AG]KAI8583913.1 hypothetical protein K450DRAFT_220562 [Umbelopsis ramanniana AG]